MDYLYGKFSKEDKSKRRRFRISTQKEQVEEWKLPQQKSQKKNLIEIPDTVSKFYKINQEIFDTFIALYDTVPILLGISSIYPNVIIEEEVISTFKSKGEVISDDDEYEFYKINLDKAEKISNGIKRINSISSISPNFPRFYIVGLISLYDHFIYNLAKAVIDSRPEIVFNSEKNISFPI